MISIKFNNLASNPASLGLVETKLGENVKAYVGSPKSLLVIRIRNLVFRRHQPFQSFLLFFTTQDLIFLQIPSFLLQILYWALTGSSVLIMKTSLILASAGLAGLSSAAFHTLKLQKIPLSKQLVGLFTSPMDVCTQKLEFRVNNNQNFSLFLAGQMLVIAVLIC